MSPYSNDEGKIPYVVCDSFFDNMAKTMLHCWDDIDHFHKDLISKDDLNAGRGVSIYRNI